MLADKNRRHLLQIASTAIVQGLQHKRLQLQESELSSALRESGACFVSLHKHGQLRGCIGSLLARQSLAQDVADNAYQAAFHDPRFTPLLAEELTELTLELSLLGPAEELTFSSEQELIQQLQAGKDGLILEYRGKLGTFLPAVWQSLPDPHAFVRHLKKKAGLSKDFWSPEIRVSRYRTEAFGEAFKPLQEEIKPTP